MEFLRIISIYLVMFNHTGTNGFFLFSVRQDSPLYILYLFISIADKIAVPIFFMISGALLLNKDESIKTIYKKRVLKSIIILVVISFSYHVYDWYYNSASFSIRNFLVRFYTYKSSTQLWYMYSYIGLLIMLPLLRKIVKSFDENDYIYLFLGHIFFVGIIPMVQYIIGNGKLNLTTNFSVALFTTTNIFYFIMGYYFQCILDKSKYNLGNVVIAILLSIIAIGVTGFMTHYKMRVVGKYDESFHTSLIAIPTFAMYFSVKYLFMRKSFGEKINNIIKIVGSTTFGIYLLERVLRERTEYIFYILEPGIKTFPACIIWIGVCLIIGFIVTYIIKKIPIVGKYI